MPQKYVAIDERMVKSRHRSGFRFVSVSVS